MFISLKHRKTPIQHGYAFQRRHMPGIAYTRWFALAEIHFARSCFFLVLLVFFFFADLNAYTLLNREKRISTSIANNRREVKHRKLPSKPQVTCTVKVCMYILVCVLLVDESRERRVRNEAKQLQSWVEWERERERIACALLLCALWNFLE